MNRSTISVCIMHRVAATWLADFIFALASSWTGVSNKEATGWIFCMMLHSGGIRMHEIKTLETSTESKCRRWGKADKALLRSQKWNQLRDVPETRPQCFRWKSGSCGWLHEKQHSGLKELKCSSLLHLLLEGGHLQNDKVTTVEWPKARMKWMQ